MKEAAHFLGQLFMDSLSDPARWLQYLRATAEFQVREQQVLDVATASIDTLFSDVPIRSSINTLDTVVLIHAKWCRIFPICR